jgi:hypothetical protein
MSMYYWKWSLGEPYYKSARPGPENLPINKRVSEYDTQQSAIDQSLSEDISNDVFVSNFSGNRREDLDNKMADRELVLQRGANPFLQQSSYVNDIVVRDMFLKPVNTTQGRVKNGDENLNESS